MYLTILHYVFLVIENHVIYEIDENRISGTEAQLNYYKHLDEMKNVKSNEGQTNTFYTFSLYFHCL